MTGSVLFAGAYDEGPGYPRTTSLRQGLQAAGIPVRECRAAGLGIDKKRALRQPWRWPGLWLAQRQQRVWLAQQVGAAVAAERPQCVVVPYPGHLCVRTVREAVPADVPVVLDLFLSAYDTVVEDRQLARPGSLAAHWLQRLDTRACAAADLVLLDTPANAAYVAALTGLPGERFTWLPVHDPAAPALLSPFPAAIGGRLRVLFFGTGVPLHGLRTLLKAGHPGALALFGHDGDVVTADLAVTPGVAAVGESVELTATLTGHGTARVDVIWRWPGARGWSSRTFRGGLRELDGAPWAFRYRLSLKPVTTRPTRPGQHELALRVNGVETAAVGFEVSPAAPAR